MKQGLKDYALRLPKAELHVHLEGSITTPSLSALAGKYGTDIAGLSPEELERHHFQYRDFEDFLGTFKLACEHLRTPEDYLGVFDRLCERFAEQNTLYAEVFYTPSIPWKWGRDGREILSALTERSGQIEEDTGIAVRWMLDCVRQFDVEAAEKTAELAAEFHGRGVIAVGLGGDEEARPAKEFEGVFSWATAHELFVHVHAGEIGGPENVWEALEVLGASRIGHGIQSARDGKLMGYLRDHAIGLDICLTSNTLTKAWPLLSDHPFRLFLTRGVPVTLNTDDPGLFRTTLTEEYQKAVDGFDLSEGDLQYLSLQGVRSAFLAHDEKTELMERFNRKIQQI